MPEYVDESVVERAAIDAVREWDMANPDIDFTMVESDADVNINWVRYLPGGILGQHRAVVVDDGSREGHSITVRLGIDDCTSTYQMFTHDAIQHTIAHEIGHYLGLRHIDDESHLMYSSEFFDVDSTRVYDNLNIGIPHLKLPKIATVAGVETQLDIDLFNAELEYLSSQRQELKNSNDAEALDKNTKSYNAMVERIQELEDHLACVDIARVPEVFQ